VYTGPVKGHGARAAIVREYATVFTRASQNHRRRQSRRTPARDLPTRQDGGGRVDQAVYSVVHCPGRSFLATAWQPPYQSTRRDPWYQRWAAVKGNYARALRFYEMCSISKVQTCARVEYDRQEFDKDQSELIGYGRLACCRYQTRGIVMIKQH